MKKQGAKPDYAAIARKAHKERREHPERFTCVQSAGGGLPV